MTAVTDNNGLVRIRTDPTDQTDTLPPACMLRAHCELTGVCSDGAALIATARSCAASVPSLLCGLRCGKPYFSVNVRTYPYNVAPSAEGLYRNSPSLAGYLELAITDTPSGMTEIFALLPAIF